MVAVALLLGILWILPLIAHTGGVQDDSTCALCHNATTTTQ